MEVQWPLVIFTLAICLSAGIFAFQGVLAIMGKGKRLQMPALITSAVIAAIGGLASFLHLENPLRIFNGFGQLSSGITQEIIAVVVMVIIMAIYFVFLLRARKGETGDEKVVPTWVGVLAVISAIVLVVVMTHSYQMAARPVWHTFALYLFYLANAALFGSLAIWVFGSITKDEDVTALAAKASIVTAIIEAIAVAVYAIVINTTSFAEVGNYFDPVAPTVAPTDPGNILTSIFTGDLALVFWLFVVVVGVILPLILVFLKLKGNGPSSGTTSFVGAALLCALAGAVAFRVILYELGASAFIYY